jgi:hypothetical protein
MMGERRRLAAFQGMTVSKWISFIPLLSLWAVMALADPQAATTKAQPAAAAPSDAQAASLEAVLKTLDHDGHDKKTRYVAAFQDLNGDGVPEAIVQLISGEWCGSGGCTLFVLKQKGGAWTEVSRSTISRPPIYVLSNLSNGWHSLGVWVQGGGIQPGYEAELDFDGHAYSLNPTVMPAHRLEGTPQGQVLIDSWKNAKFLYPQTSSVPSASTAAPVPVPANSLVGFLRRLNDEDIKQGGLQDSRAPVRYVSAYQDLNGDGMPEAIVYMLGRNWCGSGGCSTLILTQKDGAWTQVAEITLSFPEIYMLPEVSAEWHGLAVRVRDMRDDPTGDGYEATLRFDGKTYPKNPSMPPAQRLKGRPKGKVLIASAKDATPLYGAVNQ